MGLRSFAVLLSAALLLSSCTGGEARGQVAVTMTLSRHGGGIGPELDHVAQSGKAVVVVDATGERAERETNTDGVAHFEVSPGDYEVSTEFCPEGPKHVTVTKGSTVDVFIDCTAA